MTTLKPVEHDPFAPPAPNPGAATTRGTSAGGIPDLNQYFNPGAMVYNALRDLGVGFASLPFDLFGNEETARDIRSAVPRAKVGTAEDIGSSVIQYGIPGGAVAKGVRALTGGASATSRVAAGVAGATLSDVAATDPEQASTLGDLTGGPTQVRPGDPALAKRVKVGAEAGPASAVVKGGSALFGKVFGIFRSLFDSDELAERVAKEAMRAAAQNPAQAVDEINRVTAKYGSEARLTTGPASADPGLIALERGYRTRGQTAPAFGARKDEQATAVAEGVAGATQRETVPAAAARETFDRYLAGEELRVQTRLGYSALRQADAEAEFAADVAATRLLKTGAEEASKRLDPMLSGELKRLTAKKRELFDKIDPDRTVVVDPTDLEAAIKKAFAVKGSMDMAAGKMPPSAHVAQRAVMAHRIRESVEDGTLAGEDLAKTLQQAGLTVDELKYITFGDLQDLRPHLAADIQRAVTDPQHVNGEVAKRLVEVKASLEGYTDDVAALASPAGERAREALDFFRNDFAQKWRQGVGGDYAKAARSGKPIPGSDVLSRFVTTGGGSIESADDLARIVRGLPDQAAAKTEVRNYVISKFAQMAVTDNDQLARAGMDIFVRDHRFVLDRFPDIKRDIEAMRANLNSKDARVSALKSEVEARRADLKITQSEREMGIASVFLKKDPTRAMGDVMQSADPVARMDELLAFAARIPDRATRENVRAGLRHALGDWIETKIRGSGTTLTGDTHVVMANQLEKLMADPAKTRAMTRLYDGNELATLEKYRDLLRVYNRINLQATSGSPTEPLRQQVETGRIVLASMYGIVKGRGIFRLTQMLQQKLGMDPVPKADAILTKALLDPTLARIMLMPDTSVVATARLNHYLAGNLAAEFGELIPGSDRRRRRTQE